MINIDKYDFVKIIYIKNETFRRKIINKEFWKETRIYYVLSYPYSKNQMRVIWNW